MLTLDSLQEEAKARGIPISKKRGILREYTQILILKAIAKSHLADRLFFTGGTALRLVYQLPRFSEDLDFNSPSFSGDSMNELLKAVNSELTQEGFTVESQFKEKGASSLFRSRVKLTRILQDYGLSPLPSEKLEVKIEIYSPRWNLRGRSAVIQGFGEAFPILVLQESELLAEKLLALFNRRRARDIYDLFFMLRRKFPFDSEVLQSRGLAPEAKEKAGDLLTELRNDELMSLRRQLEPFLFREEEGEWIERAPEYFKAFSG